MDTSLTNDTSQSLRDQGDRFRDVRRWREAAECYRAHLTIEADDWPIMVQLGHCMKEAGDPGTALVLYRQAEIFAPRDPDIKVQIGHALRLIGRADEATQAFSQALELDPDFEPAERELIAIWARTKSPRPDQDGTASPMALGTPAPPLEDVPVIAHGVAPEPELLLRDRRIMPTWSGPAPVREDQEAALPSLLFDISDLVHHAGQARRITGIQRVQLEVSRAALETSSAAELALIAFLPDTGGWHTLRLESFQRLVAYFKSDLPGGSETIPDEIREDLAAGSPIRFRSGNTLVLLGSCWSMPGYQKALMQARQEHGLRNIPFVHDCIPLLHPQYCDPGSVRDYARWFSIASFTADAFLVNSRSTRDDLCRLQGRLLGRLAQRIETVPLDAVSAVPADDRPEGRLVVNGRKIAEPFVLFVATLEPRKDHGFVLDAWRSIAETRGEDAMPLLICVGRRGWGDAGALDALLDIPVLRRRVMLLEEVAEADLARLYAACLFTIYSSHYEGWGLPVTESIAHGRVPVIPAHSGLLESGQGCAVFYPHGAFGPFREILTRMMFDHAHRHALEHSLLSHRRLRSWREVARQITAFAEDLGATDHAPRAPRAFIRSGQVVCLRQRDLLQPSLATALIATACAGSGWGHANDLGVPMLGAGAELRLPLAIDQHQATQPCRIMLAFQGPLDQPEIRIELRSGGAEAGAPIPRVKFKADVLNIVECELTLQPGQHLVDIVMTPCGGPRPPRLVICHLSGLVVATHGEAMSSRKFRDQLILLQETGLHEGRA